MASPATVSRCGMVYNDHMDLGWEPFVQSWLSQRKDKVRTVQEQSVAQCRNNQSHSAGTISQRDKATTPEDSHFFHKEKRAASGEIRTHILHTRQLLYQLSYRGSPWPYLDSILLDVRANLNKLIHVFMRGGKCPFSP